jgi:predicted DNA-binding mobile mystery protein A
MKPAKRLRRQQLDQYFQTHLKGFNTALPKKGWIREIREALGMTMEDLGRRMSVIKQRVERLEKDEVTKKVTLESMEKAAEAMDCEFVYFFIPKASLQATLERQAERAAVVIAKSVQSTMQLEKQGTPEKSQKQLIQSLKDELLLKNDRRIWREE